MLNQMTIRVATAWRDLTTDPEIKSVGKRDWKGFLEFLTGLMEIIAPFISMCPKDSAELKARAARWLAAIDDGRMGRRRLGLIERLRLAMWQRRINRELGPEVSSEINNTELHRAVLSVVAGAEPDELTQLRGEIERAQADAA